jgi:hypothetical protein
MIQIQQRTSPAWRIAYELLYSADWVQYCWMSARLGYRDSGLGWLVSYLVGSSPGKLIESGMNFCEIRKLMVEFERRLNLTGTLYEVQERIGTLGN